ncbi:DUF2934 domain-containing protein [Shinella zoogloeoides]|uniref:DUF2934 domain-containing protein n=1 Tax=Shinella zoogloeoides TaxID=352475 RepID=A0A6N8TGS8_SHIZO|nr:DUF2934 domain-containing protein [Shinella zoogloeoides]MXO02483.1 DUF2934 domain-containing protein [Shinella zoogloeoides]UEX81940.1 DUF2934 domain-containing protein [Shinella zoogloeoides]
MDDRNEKIRKRAHEIWEEEGRPEGREYSHWLRARAEIDAEDGERPERPETGPLDLLGLRPLRRAQPA